MPQNLFTAILLAVIQGLTEFLPVSSSGHLVIVGSLLGTRGGEAGSGIMFEIAVHVGTLFAIVLHYRRKVASVLGALLDFLFHGFRLSEGNRGGLAYTGWILLGNAPTVLVGLLLHDGITAAFDAPVFAAGCLTATGLYLLFGRSRGGNRPLEWRSVLLIGAAQAVAILPGCSRSGWTITTALLLGLGFSSAAEYSFLLSIPAIIGALLLEIAKNPSGLSAGGLPVLLVGAATAFISGYAALRLLIGALNRGIFHRFSIYLIPAGLVAALYFTLAR